MGKLGISLYPEQTTVAQATAYLEAAQQFGYRRLFTSLLQLSGDHGRDQLAVFKAVVAKANQLGFQTIVDIAPPLFKELGIDYHDLSFFHDLGVWGLRLDEGFTGQEEALMTHNQYGLKIELNMSAGTNAIDAIMSFGPRRSNLLGCHNFYPQEYTGLGDERMVAYSQKFRQYGLRTAAFISAPSADHGPWPVSEGLPTLESDRHRSIASQVHHLRLTEVIDDVLIGNALASEADLKAAALAFFCPYPTLRMTTEPALADLEAKIAFSEAHLYRGDASDYLIRDTQPRVRYAGQPLPAHDATGTLHRGDVVVVNETYKRYAGELQIVLRDLSNDGRRNKIGQLTDEDLALLSLLKPWRTFMLKRVAN
ncbi:hypothetical protein AUQ39_10850 [Lacticaseibacillus casei]|uniref:DUF871 domain-containing protein n=1 Tax=Lacticaseibacillus zeae TaxID=57037 RepID=A0A5R8LSU3_LACZE|nr:MupG family TIM beta-alpha barrel fold protein [Lacticaseibacillus zeae]OLS06113.1 hypothetical protein AUQ39_10850 [Lacticaseibacillus casei]QVI31191.1 DUF871 domain-containing protein [Lacticaseibacillus zeae]TLF40304.1 DUF871 domain-containing protein [Lacticaseibacillus zeae]